MRAHELWEYAQELGKERLDNPRDDIMTALMQAEIDGERLHRAKFGSFFVLLVVGRQRDDAQRDQPRDARAHRPPRAASASGSTDFDAVAPTAIEEIVRWATPVIHFRRTATEDAVVGGQEIKAGDKVVLWYNSANRDERRVRRPVPTSTCAARPTSTSASAPAARTSASAPTSPGARSRVMFEELFRRLPDLEISGEPDYLQSRLHPRHQAHAVHVHSKLTPDPTRVSRCGSGSAR